MDIYIAGKIGDDMRAPEEFAANLKAHGHRVVEKWWQKGRLPRPLPGSRRDLPAGLSELPEGGHNCDIFILFPTDKIKGAIGEFCVALASKWKRPAKPVIVVDSFAWPDDQFVFYADDGATCGHDLAEVRAIWSGISGSITSRSFITK